MSNNFDLAPDPTGENTYAALTRLLFDEEDITEPDIDVWIGTDDERVPIDSIHHTVDMNKPLHAPPADGIWVKPTPEAHAEIGVKACDERVRTLENAFCADEMLTVGYEIDADDGSHTFTFDDDWLITDVWGGDVDYEGMPTKKFDLVSIPDDACAFDLNWYRS